MDGRTGRTGDDTNGARIFGQGFLRFLGKQALGFQLSFQLLKGRVKITNTVHGHGSTVKLIGAVSRKDGNLAHGNDFHAIFRAEPQAHGISFEHNALQSAGFVLQGEIMVSGGIEFVVADLTPNGYLGQ